MEQVKKMPLPAKICALLLFFIAALYFIDIRAAYEFLNGFWVGVCLFIAFLIAKGFNRRGGV